MSAILITYDLNSPGQRYAKLHEAIKNVGSSWWHYLDSTWIVSGAALTPQGVFAAMAPHLDATDRALVLNVSGDSNQGWLSEDAWVWIREHVAR